MKHVVATDKAPGAIGIYSQAVLSDKVLFCSGQLGMDPKTGEISDDFEEQMRQALKNVVAIVQAAGGKPSDIVRQEVFLTDLANFATVNKVMESFFCPPYPARSCFQVAGLPKGALVEVQATAVLD